MNEYCKYFWIVAVLQPLIHPFHYYLVSLPRLQKCQNLILDSTKVIVFSVFQTLRYYSFCYIEIYY